MNLIPLPWILNDGVSTPTSLDVGWNAVQPIRVTQGVSYTLKFKSRNASQSGRVDLSIRFRTAGYETYREYKRTLTGEQAGEISFTAHAYTSNVDVVITCHNTRVSFTELDLSEREPIQVIESPEWTQFSFVPDGYRLTFNDEFRGSSLNRDKWHTRLIYAAGTLDHLNDEAQRYRDNDNHVVSGGFIRLVARKKPDGSYESGMIRSNHTQRYGYFEARVKMPNLIGAWPAFWLNSDVSEAGRLTWPPEIDIFEWVNNGVEDTPDMIHSGAVGTASNPSPLISAVREFNHKYTFWRAPFKFTDGWHTISLEWLPDKIIMYVDGKKIYTRAYEWIYDDGTLAGPAHIILNFALGGSWAGRHGIDDSALPAEFLVNWVRAYQK